MAYDEGLAERIRAALGDDGGDVVERKMFGGIAFLLNGNMSVGVTGDSLMVRVGIDDHEAALEEPGARPFDMTGRPMRGWVVVDPIGIDSDSDLHTWDRRGVAFAASLPPK